MDDALIERLAREAGFEAPDDAHRYPDRVLIANAEDLRRFVALVAEECAKVAAGEAVNLLRWALGELAAEADYSSGRNLAEMYEEGVAKAEDRANYLRAIALTGF